MNDLPLHIERKWEVIRHKAQVRGATLSKLSKDFEDALRASLEWWLKADSEKKLTQTDDQ
ncbi:MAG TPA: hypothetical protein VF088_03225 [Pyrinomonadaceae bacterium]